MRCFPTLGFVAGTYAEVLAPPPKKAAPMLAIPLVTPLQESLLSHVFGRLIARTPPARAAAAPVDASAAPAMPEPLEDELPDLAQRVREIGEW